LAYEKRGLSRRYTLRRIPKGCDTVFFPGCTLAGTRPHIVQAVYERLAGKIPALGIVLDCCSKISHDLARTEVFRHNMNELTTFLTERKITQVITSCPSCTEMFREYGQGCVPRSVYQVLDELNLYGKPVSGRTMQVHDCCVDRFEDRTQESARNILQKQGIQLEEMHHSGRTTVCCGEGGLASYVAPDLSQIWSDKRIAEVLHTVAAPCAGCVSRMAGPINMIHVLDMWFDPDRAFDNRISTPRWPLTSWNRFLLKRKLKRLPGDADISERNHQTAS
jgi:Fe-S oxidoreductase